MTIYGRIRILSNSIRSDTQYLKNAPLGRIQQKRIQKEIDRQKVELKQARDELRGSKIKK